MSTTSDRVDGLDILKAFCTFCIMIIHAPIPGEIGMYIEALSRIAVPIFFMITGFFYVDTQAKKKELAQIKKMFWLCVYANALYLPWGLVLNRHAGESIQAYVSKVFAPKALLEWLVFNQSPFSGHLWYLGAILYALMIVYVLNRVCGDKSSRILLVAAPFLLLINLALGNYSRLLFQREFSSILTRNFLFCGIPYFTLGYFLRKRKDIAEALCARPVFLVSAALFFACTTIAELFLVHHFGIAANVDLFISTTFLSIVVFSACTSPYWNRKMPVLRLIGRKYAVYIYIFHPIVIAVLNTVAKLLRIYDFYVYCRPVAVFVVSTLMSIAFIKTRACLTSKLNGTVTHQACKR